MWRGREEKKLTLNSSDKALKRAEEAGTRERGGGEGEGKKKFSIFGQMIVERIYIYMCEWRNQKRQTAWEKYREKGKELDVARGGTGRQSTQIGRQNV